MRIYNIAGMVGFSISIFADKTPILLNLRIRDILVRIHIRESVFRILILLQILHFSSMTFKVPTKVFCLLLFEGTFTSIFKIRNQGFSYNFNLMTVGSGSVPLTNGPKDPDPGGLKNNTSLKLNFTCALRPHFTKSRVLFTAIAQDIFS
jgi:hypothetical protein